MDLERGGEGVENDFGVLVFPDFDLTNILHRHKLEPAIAASAFLLPPFMPGADAVTDWRNIFDRELPTCIGHRDRIMRRHIQPGALPRMSVTVDLVEPRNHQWPAHRRRVRRKIC